MTSSIIKTKNEEAINLRQKYIHSYDTFYNNKHKVTSNKLVPEIFKFL